MNRTTWFWILMLSMIALWSVGGLMAQGKIYDGPDDPAGDIAAEREGYMTGNRVFLYFRNTTELSDWPKAEVSRWPNNYEGVKMTDGIGLLVGALVFIEQDTIPVTDPGLIATMPGLDTLYYLQTSYREHMDRDPTGTVEWGLYPVFGYFNENNEYPAMSNLPDSWPPAGWPFKGRQVHWAGEWDGRFGRGQIRSNLETYFVANDAQDQENLGPEDIVRYRPRPGVSIGDIRPDVTIQKGLPWGGIGIRVAQRGFQWSHPQARDAIFWEYTIANISDYDLPQVAFGYWVDNAIGQDGDDELGYFDRKIDMAYSWDIDGIGRGGRPTGTMGFAYLESPGMGFDNVDNDEDGLTDEKRDNEAVALVGPTGGISNIGWFLDTFQKTEADLREHWDADEDQDWEDGIDSDGDGVYQLNEYAGDDVGLDGVGPTEINYTGPDEGECNHKPDTDGVNSEPNFATVDVSESDMVGLTAFMLFPIQPERPPYTKWFRNDKSMWDVIGQDTLIEYLGRISNLVETFASGPFPLYQGRQERISMSELHSYDPLEGLNSTDHAAPALYEQKRIVQIIYEKDYQFAMPPKMPTLSATPMDGSVILTWDNISDTKTRDPMLGNINDFEGYKVFRTTDKKWSDAEVITDGYGTPMFKKPVFQCDIIDGRKGFTNYGLKSGMGYNLGYDTGIVHHWIDTNVQNGRTYYYAVVAYDYGIPDLAEGIAPSENKTIIELDEAEDIRAIGQNVAVVTPHQLAAGYVPPSVEPDASSFQLGTGTVEAQILAGRSLKTDHTYGVTFSVDTLETVSNYDHGIRYTNNAIIVKDLTDGSRIVYQDSPDYFAYNNLVEDEETGLWTLKTDEPITTDIFDGLRLHIEGQVSESTWDFVNTGWLTGDAALFVIPSARESKLFPWDYDIVFTEQPDAYTGRITVKTMRDERGDRLDRTELITEVPFSFYVVNRSHTDSTGAPELMDMVVHDKNGSGQFEILQDRILVGPVNSKGWWAGTIFVLDFRSITDEANLPEPGDVYRVRFRRPFTAEDQILFTVREGSGLDEKALKSTMKQIKAVPNPYVATNAMEPAVSNPLLNQRRRLLFTHLPARCTVKIYTVSGALVDVIEVDNPADDGITHWDLLTQEGLEVAAGMYIFHVRASDTGDEMFGKFAIIK